MRDSLSFLTPIKRIHPTLHPPPALSFPRRIHESSSIAFVPYAMQSQPDNYIRLERKKGKEEKARLKELKKQKAAERAASAKLMAPQEVGNNLKKSALKNVKKDAGEDKAEDYIYPETPLGEKKRLPRQMAKWYNPTAVEKSWYEWWEKSQFFVADASSSKPPFVIVLPPPNITGALHIGHALVVAIEDTIIRWKRMSGYNALWIPGMDHAGIATEFVLEKKLMRERQRRKQDVRREKFVAEAWKWKEEYGRTIIKQARRLGASLDWSRECFTMDEKRSRAVTEAFVRLYKEGLIYRDFCLVNWDFILRTAISDSEVSYVDIKGRTLLRVPGYADPVEFGVLTYFAYPIQYPPEEGPEEIVVATTWVETMLGDTAIAVHPEDERYKKLHGKIALHPFYGSRRLRIVCDEIIVDPSFGSGAVKICPSHDPVDFDAGERHTLEFIHIYADDGRMSNLRPSEFAGMQRFVARQAVIEALKAKGLYRGAEDHEMRLCLSSRTGDVIRPLMKRQWWLNCNTMAKETLDAVTDENHKKLEIIPKQQVAKWTKWLNNVRDWCISRQLWWGHRIPAWYVTLKDDRVKVLGAYNDHWVVARDEQEARAAAEMKFAGMNFQLRQDPDVLDTWFSSSLFPLSALGWPDDTVDLKTFYPTSVLETGHDIFFLWVARMALLGTKLGGDMPFRQVYLHPMVRDALGRKMSKSLGSIIDPLEVVNGVTFEGLNKRLEEANLDPKELGIANAGLAKDFPNGIPECGADALRFALVSYTAQSDKINMDNLRVVGYRQWCNKLWNAVWFATSKLGSDYIPPETLALETMPLSCKWILCMLNKTISKTISSLDSYEFSDAATTVYSWWQHQFCDVFLEAIEPYFVEEDTFASERSAARYVLWVCLENGLRLLHPFMPFITEELWQRLPSPKGVERKESIMKSDYPSPVECWTNERAEQAMDLIQSVLKGLRSLRSAVPSKQKNECLPAYVYCQTEEVWEIMKSHKLEIVTLATLSSLEVLLSGGEDAPTHCAFENVNENLKVYLKVEGNVNAEAQREKTWNNMKENLKEQE